MMPVTVDLAVEDDRWLALAGGDAASLADLLTPLVERALSRALAGDGTPVEVAVVLADDGQVQALNRHYRGIDRPTNVLSFALADAADGGPAPAGAPTLLGDVVVAYETLMAEAAAEAKAPIDHLRHLVVHGVLHLLGFGHDDEPAAVAMETLETAILAEAGIADPYQAADR